MIQVNRKYKPLYENNTRFYIITGGRGSGKSYEVNTFLNTLSFEQGHNILFTRYTMTSAHLSIIPEFTSKIEEMNASQFFTINKTEIVNNMSGSQIWFKGIKTSSGNQTASLKSLSGVTTWVLDEAEELTDETIFDKINLSVRTKGKQNRIILILNPATKEHWIYKRFFEEMGVNEGFNGVKGDVTYIHTTYLDNYENLAESFIADVERVKESNPKKYNHVVLGGWLDKAEGVVFNNWRIDKYNPNNLQTIFGQDFGFTIDPTTLIEIAVDKKNRKLYVKEHLYKTNLVTTEIIHINKTKAGKSLIVADNAEQRLVEEIRRAGVNIIAPKKETIEFGISMMQDYEIIVEENSTNIIKELNNYAYADKGSKLYADNYNHAIDAIRYAFLQLVNKSGQYKVY